MLKFVKTLFTMCVFLLGPAMLWAQGRGGPPPGRGGPPQDRARTFLVVRIAEVLDLSDQQALEVSRILRESETHREDLQKQRQEVEKQIQAALGGGESEEAGLRELVVKANEIDAKLAMVPEGSMQEVQRLLTPEKQAKLVLFRSELRGQIRQRVRERMRIHQDQPGPTRPGDDW